MYLSGVIYSSVPVNQSWLVEDIYNNFVCLCAGACACVWVTTHDNQTLLSYIKWYYHRRRISLWYYVHNFVLPFRWGIFCARSIQRQWKLWRKLNLVRNSMKLPVSIVRTKLDKGYVCVAINWIGYYGLYRSTPCPRFNICTIAYL